MISLMGLCRDWDTYAWTASALDRTGGDGVVAAESHGNSLDEATGPREPWRELSSLPTDDERLIPVVSSGLAVNAEKACDRDPALDNLDDN